MAMMLPILQISIRVPTPFKESIFSYVEFHTERQAYNGPGLLS